MIPSIHVKKNIIRNLVPISEADNFLSFNDLTIVGERLNLDFISRKAYVPIPAAIYNHILTSPILADKEKQLYFLAHSLVEIKEKKEDRNEVGLCGKFWAKRLGCCVRTIFDMQKKLELHGYFKITRSKSSSNHNNRNVIQVTLPDQICRVVYPRNCKAKRVTYSRNFVIYILYNALYTLYLTK